MSTIKIRINMFEFIKITLFKMANSPVRNVRSEETGNENWSIMRWFSFQNIDLLIDYWNPGLFKVIFEAITFCRSKMRWRESQRPTTTITKTALPLMFSSFFGTNINDWTKWKCQPLRFKAFSYSSNTSSSNNYFLVFQNPHFGKFGRTAP